MSAHHPRRVSAFDPLLTVGQIARRGGSVSRGQTPVSVPQSTVSLSPDRTLSVPPATAYGVSGLASAQCRISAVARSDGGVQRRHPAADRRRVHVRRQPAKYQRIGARPCPT
jgi:hypothetical protein